MTTSKISSLQENLRELKSSVVHQYFRFRINSNTNPYQVLFRHAPYRVLFLLGHMRAASSLLSHILCSNPEIIGYGETHTQYHSELDLKNLFFKVYGNYYQLKNMTMSHKYIFDKVLHNNKILTDNLLKSDQVYALFLVREPARTIASIIDLKEDWTEEKALQYYLERLAKLEADARLINSKKHSLFIKQEQLLTESNKVFAALQNFLETKTEFSEQYEVTKTTGMRYIGDQTENIKAGRIVRDQRKLDIQLSENTVEKARQEYEQCCQTLSDYCRLV
jgi:hypothetical protein